MRHVTYRHAGFTITNYGNGTSYVIQNDKTGKSVFIDGEDAIQWELVYDNIPNPQIMHRFLSDTVDDYQRYKKD